MTGFGWVPIETPRFRGEPIRKSLFLHIIKKPYRHNYNSNGRATSHARVAVARQIEPPNAPTNVGLKSLLLDETVWLTLKSSTSGSTERLMNIYESKSHSDAELRGPEGALSMVMV